MELTEFKSVQRMLGELKLLTRSKNTELTYLKALKSLLKQVNLSNPDILIEKVKNKELNADEIYKQYIVNLASQNLAPKSIAAWAAGVRKFFSANGIDVKVVPMRVYTLHEDVLPTKEELRTVLANSTLKARTCILILLSSGLRVGELHQLKLADIDLEENPPKIRVKAISAKERKGRITFISFQARDVLKEYLERRKLKEKLTPDSPLIATDDGRPMSYQNLQYILNNALKRVGKKMGKRYTLHPHILRKWFKTQMISAGLPPPIVDKLMGHARYLAKEYELYTEDQLREWYLKGMGALTL